jgi:hypothetical protein
LIKGSYSTAWVGEVHSGPEKVVWISQLECLFKVNTTSSSAEGGFLSSETLDPEAEVSCERERP